MKEKKRKNPLFSPPPSYCRCRRRHMGKGQTAVRKEEEEEEEEEIKSDKEGRDIIVLFCRRH